MRQLSLALVMALVVSVTAAGPAFADSPSNAEQAFKVPATITFSPSGVATVPTVDTWTQGTSPTGAACCTNDFYAPNGKRSVTTSRNRVPSAFGFTDGGVYESCGFHVDSYDANGVYVGSVFSEAPTFCLYAFAVQETDRSAGLRYRGNWFEASPGTPWDGGTSFSTDAAAAVTYECGYCRSIEWVTTTGPTHGSASVYINGALVADVSTHASSTHYRTAVFHYELPSLATFSTIRIVNDGTPRHSRIDLDAFVVTDED